MTYTVTVAALGPATSTIVNAQDVLPGGLSLVSATTSVGAYNMSTGNWSIGTLAPNATATLVLAATVDPREAGQTITNTATVTELSSLVDQNPGNNSSSVSIFVQSTSTGPLADISVLKSVDNAAPHEGDTVNYTVTVSAQGPATSTGVVATDALPSGLTFVNATSSAGQLCIFHGNVDDR